MRLNLNETVKVKLTERGKELYRQYFSPLPDGFKQPEPRIDEDGFTKIQLWMFMEMFGEHMSIGQPNVIKPLEIVFDTENPEDSEDCKEQKSKLESDLISRQAVLDILNDAWENGYEDQWRLVKEVELLSPVEPKPVCEDAISKHDLWRIIEDNAYWITYNETSKEKGMTLTGINQALNECPPVEPERPKGEWVDFDLKPAPHGVPVEKCGNCGEWSTQMGKNFCPDCGADMKGDKE